LLFILNIEVEQLKSAGIWCWLSSYGCRCIWL